MDVVAALIADDEAAEAVEPGQCALGDPAMSAKFFAAVDAAPGDPRSDAALAARSATEAMIVGLVGVQLVRPASWPAAAAFDRRDRIECRRQHHAVVPIGRAQHNAERRAL